MNNRGLSISRWRRAARVALGWIMTVGTVLAVRADVHLDAYNFATNSLPVAWTDEAMPSYYKLRVKIIVPWDPGYHHATDQYNNNQQVLQSVPGAGTYDVDLYWIKYDSSGNNGVVGPMSRRTITISAPPATAGTGTGLKAEYFNNSDLSGAPVYTNTSGEAVNHIWGSGGTAWTGTDYFSVRWSGQVEPRYSGEYTFTTRSDDGMRVFINQALVAGAWYDHGTLDASGRVYLTAGQRYDIRVEFFENAGGANAQLFWQSASQAWEIVPRSQLYTSGGSAPQVPAITSHPVASTVNTGVNVSFSVATTGSAPLSYQWRKGGVPISASSKPSAATATLSISGVQASDAGDYDVVVTNSAGSATSNKAALVIGSSSSGGGLTGHYYDNADLSGLVFTRVDPNVNLNFDVIGGAPDSRMGSDTFSVRWTGQVQPPTSEPYTFIVNSDDGARLWVNGKQIINAWSDHPQSDSISETITLAAEQRYDVKLEYYENSGGAAVSLLWQTPTRSREIIPATRLYPVASGSSPTGPSITTQPQSKSVMEGSSASFTVGATGTAPLAYQWRKNGAVMGGATNSTYAISSVQPAHGGSYDVVVTNSVASAVSAPAQLQVTTGLGLGTGLTADIYDDMYLNIIRVSRIDPQVNFNWGGGSPDGAIGPDTFSIRWRGQLQAQESGTYQLITSTDDGVTLKVGGVTLITDTACHDVMDNVRSFSMIAGSKYDIEMTYFENGGGAVARLSWIRPGQAQRETIPAAQLYPAPLAETWRVLLQASGAITSEEEVDDYGNGTGNWTGSSYTHKFSVPGNGALRVYTKGWTDTAGRLTKSLDSSVNFSAGGGGENQNFVISVQAATPGDYFIEVSGQYADVSGDYQIFAEFMPAAPRPLITSPLAAAGVYGVPWTYTIEASNSPTSYNASNLPSGLSFNRDTRTLSGIPLQASDPNPPFAIPLTAANAGGIGSATLNLTIAKAKPAGRFDDIISEADVFPIDSTVLNRASFSHPTHADFPGVAAPNQKKSFTAFWTSEPSRIQNPEAVYLTVHPFSDSLKVTAHYPGDSNYTINTVTSTIRAVDKAAPDKPTGVREVLVLPNSISVVWDASLDNPKSLGAPSPNYEVRVDHGTQQFPVMNASGVIRGLLPGTTHVIEVRARDLAGNYSEWAALPYAVTTATIASDPQTPRWFDVGSPGGARDGIRDEIIGGGTDVFAYGIVESASETFTEHTWTSTFVPTVGLSFEDGFSWMVNGWWMPAAESTEVTITQVRPYFHFVTEPGYEYALYRAITSSQGQTSYYRIQSWPPSEAGGIVEWLPATFWPEDAFYAFPTVLARFAKPIGSVSVGGLSTTVLGTTRGAGGVLQAVLPPGGQISISLKDTVDKLLKAGPAVIYEIWDGINRIGVGQLTIGNVMDIGINTSGQFQIGLKLDDSTTVWFNLTVTTPPPPKMAVDANRDGQIRFDGSDATSAAAPYRFWINDDDDSESIDTGSADVPSASAPDYLTPQNGGIVGTVQGGRDLVDWFPVALDIRQLLAVLPPSETVKYKLSQSDSAFNFVYTDLSVDRTFSYNRPTQGTPPLSSGFGPNLAQAPFRAYKRQITSAGIDLFGGPDGSTLFLDAILNRGGGVVMVEGRSPSNAPIVLSIEKSGAVVSKSELHVTLSVVESMYRHLNLRDLSFYGLVGQKNDAAMPTAMGDPKGFPDAQSSSDHWLIFLHGYNVHPNEARGWNTEMFKRFYCSGSKAKFIAVTWFGNPSDGFSLLPSDYYEAVRNAFVTARHLAPVVNNLAGPKTTVSHSLGCGVVAAAIADYGMRVDKALFLNAALPRESFDGEIIDEANGMTPAAWRGYDPRYFAANWHLLFEGSDDARKKLTWRHRFGRAAMMDASRYVYNFYSSSEEVLAAYEGEVPDWWWTALPHVKAGAANSWVFQEKAKGAKEDYFLGVTHIGSLYGGWGFNINDPIVASGPKWYYLSTNHVGAPIRRPKYAHETGDAVLYLAELKRTPLFKTGWGRWDPNYPELELIDREAHEGPDWIFDLYDPIAGSAQASDPLKRSQLLAEAIPALTCAMGSRRVGQVPNEQQFNLPQLTDNWPREEVKSVAEWRHNDICAVAYMHQYRVFDQMVALTKQRN